jgi:hypothetical protein
MASSMRCDGETRLELAEKSQTLFSHCEWVPAPGRLPCGENGEEWKKARVLAPLSWVVCELF